MVNIIFTCVGCGDTLDTATDDMQAAKHEMQQAGWMPNNTGTFANPVWQHYCPKQECRDKLK